MASYLIDASGVVVRKLEVWETMPLSSEPTEPVAEVEVNDTLVDPNTAADAPERKRDAA